MMPSKGMGAVLDTKTKKPKKSAKKVAHSDATALCSGGRARGKKR